MSERVPDAQTSFTPSLNATNFPLRTESPIQDIIVNRIDLIRMIVLDAFALG